MKQQLPEEESRPSAREDAGHSDWLGLWLTTLVLYRQFLWLRYHVPSLSSTCKVAQLAQLTSFSLLFLATFLSLSLSSSHSSYRVILVNLQPKTCAQKPVDPTPNTCCFIVASVVPIQKDISSFPLPLSILQLNLTLIKLDIWRRGIL